MVITVKSMREKKKNKQTNLDKMFWEVSWFCHPSRPSSDLNLFFSFCVNVTTPPSKHHFEKILQITSKITIFLPNCYKLTSAHIIGMLDFFDSSISPITCLFGTQENELRARYWHLSCKFILKVSTIPQIATPWPAYRKIAMGIIRRKHQGTRFEIFLTFMV